MQTSSQQARAVTISVFDGARDNEPETLTISWDAFTARWGIPDLVPGTDKVLKEQGEAWSPFTFNGTRAKDTAQLAGMVGLDIDEGLDGAPGITDDELAALDAKLGALGVSYAYHSTFRSGLVAPRHKLRVVVPLDRDVDLTTYVALVDELAAKLGVVVDTSRRGDAGLFFSPRIPEGHINHYKHKVVSRGYYQVRGPGSGLFERVRTAVIPSGGRKTLAQWCELLKTTTEKHNTLRDAAFSLAAGDKERGLDVPVSHWDAFEAALKLNPTPVSDWDAAFKTYELSRDAGYEKAEVIAKDPDPLELPKYVVSVTPSLQKKAASELAAVKRALKSHNDSQAVTAAAQSLGRYVPHVLSQDTVRETVARAAQNSGSIRAASDIASEIETGLAAGMSQPKGRRLDWQEGMTIDDDGRLDPTEENLTCLLNNHPDTSNIFARNVRTSNTWLLAQPPWEFESDTYPAPFDLDCDHLAAALWARDISNNKGYGHKVTQKVIKAVAMSHPFDPFLDWVKAQQWDGTERLSRWLVRAGGCEDTDYVRAVSRRWLIGACARTADPGCQMDTVIVLKGAQGIGKSTILRELVPTRDYYSDSVPDIKDKDATKMMSKFAIIEIAELTGFSKQDAEKIKHFITQSKGDMRAAYAEEDKDYPRRCVLAGTTNKEQFLNDPTGARRFWPVAVTQADKNWLTENRAQLWAEAYAAYLSGEQWHLTPEEESLAKLAQEETQEGDENLDMFLSYHENLPVSMRTGAVATPGLFDGVGPAKVHVYSDQMEGDKPRYWTVRQLCELLGMNTDGLLRNQKYLANLLTQAGYVNKGRCTIDGKKISKYVKR